MDGERRMVALFFQGIGVDFGGAADESPATEQARWWISACWEIGVGSSEICDLFCN